MPPPRFDGCAAIQETFWTDPEDVELDALLRKEPWKEFEPITGPFPAQEIPAPPEPELYNLADDPGEEHNLAGQHPGRVRKMLCELETWFEAVERERAAIDELPGNR